MLDSVLTDVLYLAQQHEFKFVPAAGADWVGDFDRGKQPLVSIHQATADAEQLRAWAECYRNCNWLFVPGEGQAVLDVDPRHGGDVLLKELEARHGPLPVTARCRTGGGGWHYYLTCDSLLSLKRDIGGNPGLTLATGGKLGFIVPPCVHKSGKPYTWEPAPWDCAPAPCPHWLVELAQAGAVNPGAPAPVQPVSVKPGPLQFVWGGGDGLARHPGEGEGQRHKTACVLIGRELGRGRSAQEIEPELLVWADRCVPPMPHADALRQLRGLSRKHDAQAEQQHTTTTRAKEAPEKEGMGSMVGEVPAEVPTPFLPSPPLTSPSFPVGESEGKKAPTPADAWLGHGLVGRIAQAVGPQLEGAVEPVVCCLLSCFGSAVGPGPFVRVGGAKHRPNLFAVLVAPSGVGKSEPWDVCDVLMRYAEPEWHRTAVTYGLGSGEGLIERLEQQPVAFAIEAEFGGLLAKARREGSTLTATICNAWDGRRLEVANRGGAKLMADGHHVSAWANITDAELHKRLSGSIESANGFGNRFLWVRQQRQRHLPFGGDLRPLEGFAGPLRAALAKARAIGEVQWSEEAKPLWKEAYPRLCEAQEQHWSLGRARSQALRLTLVYALLDGSDRIMPEHVRAGLSAWAWCEASAKAIFGGGDTPTPRPGPEKPGAGPLQLVWSDAGAEQHNTHTQTQGADAGAGKEEARRKAPLSLPERAVARIEAQPGIGRGALAKALKAQAGELAAVLAGLHAEGRAHPRLVPGKGRTPERWWPGPEAGAEQQAHTAREREDSPDPGPDGGLTAPSFSPLPSPGEASPPKGKEGGVADADTLPSPAQAQREGSSGGSKGGEGSPPPEPEPMSEGEFFAGLQPCGGILPTLPSPRADDEELAWVALLGGMGVVVQQGPVRLPWLPADLEARVWDRFDHAGTVRLKVLMPDARHAELPPAVRDRLRRAYPGQYITDVPEGELAPL